MKEHIIRAILYEDMSVKWKDEDENGGNVRLNVHQKTRQFVELELGDFILSDGEAILAAFEHATDGETNHINPSLMQKIDGEENAYRIQIPLLVHSTPGEWGVQFFVTTDYAAGEYANAYPSNKMYFTEGSSFFDDGLTIPSAEDFNALYAAATDAKVIATGAKDEAIDANIEVQAARAETEELAANAAASAKSAADSESIALQHRMDYTPKIEQNSRDIKNLYAINEQNGQFARLKVAQAYASRATADGANIFDDQLTPVLEIAGSTVKTTNRFDISAVSGTNVTITDRDITLTNTNIRTVGSMKELFPNLTVDKTYTLVSTVEGNPNISSSQYGGMIYSVSDQNPILRPHSNGTISKQFTLTERLYNGQLAFYGLTDGTVTWKDLRCFEGQYTATNAPEWTPYFAGLKHANINSIVSKNQDGTQQSVFQLPETVELAEYDKILPQTGEIVRATGYATSETGFTDEEIANYNNAVVSNDRKSLVYELETATTTPINAPKVYTAWNGGSETIIQGETDNSKFGAMPTVTQTYFGKVGEE